MAAAAPARRAAAAPAPARRKPKRRPAARQAVRATPARARTSPSRKQPARRRPQRSGHFVPYAVGRTAGAVRHLPDSGLVFRLTRGRAWIGLLSVLLIGIVALNVVSLSLSASQGKLSQQAMILQQENSALRARLAERLSSDRVRNAAAGIGMTAPVSTEINYRDASGDAVRLAAGRLAAGFGLGGYSVSAPATTAPAPVPDLAVPAG